jgi:hypothetical protein
LEAMLKPKASARRHSARPAYTGRGSPITNLKTTSGQSTFTGAYREFIRHAASHQGALVLAQIFKIENT